ncbi:2-hexaprenyl-6-methoxy-1,4-benzoquinone methyltransferase [Balamuthia mandrillaris]
MQQESRKEQEEEEVRPPPQPTAPTEGMLRSIWNEFAPTFAQEARWTDQVAHTLAAHLQLGSAQQAILEIGSGAGGGTEIICRAKPENVRVVATDLSTEFIAIAKKRLEGKAEVEFVEANAEKLPFDDASFDRYMASFVLHLVTDPKSMLAECKRVLQPGKGMAAFSVWGRKEHSPHFTIVPEVAKRLGIDLTQVGGAKPEMRSNFHLGDDPAALRRMALEAGFSKAFTWYQV